MHLRRVKCVNKNHKCFSHIKNIHKSQQILSYGKTDQGDRFKTMLLMRNEAN